MRGLGVEGRWAAWLGPWRRKGRAGADVRLGPPLAIGGAVVVLLLPLLPFLLMLLLLQLLLLLLLLALLILLD